MTTAKDLVDRALEMLHGYGSTQDLITPLTAGIGPTDTTFQVDFTFGQSAGVTAGFVEIDSEQLYVTNVDQTTGICTLANGFGRGFNDTTPASHAAGSVVISQPRFPRKYVLTQLNEVINDVFPQLYSVQKYTTTVQFPSNEYPLPVSPPGNILAVDWQDVLGNWRKARSYTFDSFDGNLRLGGGCMIGRPLRVLYTTQPNKFASETDDFSVTGLPDSASDVLYLGVVAKELPGLDISRAQTDTVEQSDRSRVVPPNAGITAAGYIQKLYEDRLANEAKTLRTIYKPRLVKVF